jgi:hypothetical protein
MRRMDILYDVPKPLLHPAPTRKRCGSSRLAFFMRACGYRKSEFCVYDGSLVFVVDGLRRGRSWFVQFTAGTRILFAFIFMAVKFTLPPTRWLPREVFRWAEEAVTWSPALTSIQCWYWYARVHIGSSLRILNRCCLRAGTSLIWTLCSPDCYGEF